MEDVYCYANPKNFEWEESASTFCFKYNYSTLFHVYKKSDWEETFPDANVTFVSDLKRKVTTNVIIRNNTPEYWSSFYDSTVNHIADKGIRVYQVSIDSNGELSLIEVSDRIINKGQGVLLKSATEDVSLAYSEEESSIDYSTNCLLGSDIEITNPGNAYVLNSQTSGLGFYKLSADGKIRANKAYLVYNNAGVRTFIAFDNENVTGIQNVETGVKKNKNIYNLNGQRLSHPSKGIYLVNGKKVIN